ncbi:MAG: LysR family transcriptional regulator [Pseudomonadales bacterium]|nr:LysR family transcriptional regulator [Pseudomonadales bacterium]
MTDLDDMGLFAAVIRAQSFTKAADMSGVPLSTISRRLANLEERLGVKLVERTTRKMQLTESGKIYYDYCETVVKQAEEARQALQDLRAEPEGHLVFAATVGSDDSWGTKMLSGFLQKYPKITLEAKVIPRDVDFEEVDYDLCFAHGAKPITRHMVQSLGTTTLSLCASPRYLAGIGVPTSIDDLVNYDFIGCDTFSWDEYRPTGCENVTLKSRITTSEILIARKSAVDGLGVAYLPNLAMTPQIKNGELQLILPEYKYDLPAWMILPKDKKIARKLEVFVQYFLAQAESSAPWNFTHNN